MSSSSVNSSSPFLFVIASMMTSAYFHCYSKYFSLIILINNVNLFYEMFSAWINIPSHSASLRSSIRLGTCPISSEAVICILETFAVLRRQLREQTNEMVFFLNVHLTFVLRNHISAHINILGLFNIVGWIFRYSLQRKSVRMFCWCPFAISWRFL